GDEGTPPPSAFVSQLLGLAPALDVKEELLRAMDKVTAAQDGQYADWQFAALAGALEALLRRGQAPDRWLSPRQLENLHNVVAGARKTVADDKASEARRLAALQLLGREPSASGDEQNVLLTLLLPQ